MNSIGGKKSTPPQRAMLAHVPSQRRPSPRGFSDQREGLLAQYQAEASGQYGGADGSRIGQRAPNLGKRGKGALMTVARKGRTSLGVAKSSASRVRRHRQQFIRDGNVRLEVSIGRDVADDVRLLALQRGCRVWEVVQAALTEYVTGNKARAGGTSVK